MSEITLCMKCHEAVVNNMCGCDIVITLEQFEKLCKTDKNKLKEILRKVGKRD